MSNELSMTKTELISEIAKIYTAKSYKLKFKYKTTHWRKSTKSYYWTNAKYEIITTNDGIVKIHSFNKWDRYLSFYYSGREKKLSGFLKSELIIILNRFTELANS